MADGWGVKPEIHSDVYDAISPTKLTGSLEGKVAFVSGAGRGIGKSIALALAEAGAHVALLSRTKSELDAVAEIITSQFHRKSLVCVADASDESAVAQEFARVEQELGKVDIAIANAAINSFRPLVYTPLEEWWRIMEINVKGPVILTQLAMRSMRERNEGAIIVITSKAALLNLAGPSAYCASKSAVVRTIGCLQLEMDAEHDGNSGVHMYTVHPGAVKTPMTTTEKVAHPDMDKMKPGSFDRVQKNFASFGDSQNLSAWLCVYLATGHAKELRGRYIDATNDIAALVAQADIIKNENLYALTANALGRK
ncbi:NAD-binding protein [Schizopora paradoxa]|uniref:NAD-binding protein n=1 Tax=Schizopora paradoxa TaxID=27342 RepID=A0A0H2RYZ5_9AGAM|nr:NAD-binding protein [Schizopora paradoxa]